MKRMARLGFCILQLLCACTAAGQPIRVGSKHFTEGYLLSEMLALLIEDQGLQVERRFHLGGTMVCYGALKTNEIDIYPEYSGTLSSEILKLPRQVPLEKLRDTLRHMGFSVSDPYGFQNTYALVVTQTLATRLGIKKVSDLRSHPELRIGLSYEFLKRQDGWDNLVKAYRLSQPAFGLEHGLAYTALSKGTMDVTDAYSTDGEIEYYQLQLLDDDLRYFPEYQAMSFYRKGLPPAVVRATDKLVGSVSAAEMQSLNADVLFRHQSYSEVARAFLLKKGLIHSSGQYSASKEIFDKTLEHLGLTLISLVLSVSIALPLSIAVYRRRRLSQIVMYAAGLLQTIPSIALLAVLIPLTGIGAVPAVMALFLYGLLPIVRNTVAGLNSVDAALRRVADGMGMSPFQKLRLVEFPLATPAILAGIRTAAVINIGTATLAAFIGAGGLGEFIVTGLALNSYQLILRGAVPAAGLAILTELLFEGIQRIVIPRYLRNGSA